MQDITERLKKNKRYIFMLLGIMLFLPPLSVIPQAAGEVNMCGAVCPRMFFILSPKGIWSGAVSGIQSMWFGAALVGAIFIVTLFWGRLWCSHVCPIGSTSEIISRCIPKKMKMDFSAINAPAFRYGYLLIFIAGTLFGIGSIACKLCNFRVIPFLAGAAFVPAYRTYLATSMGMAGLITIGISGFFARGGRGYCNLLCPVGALDSIVNALGSKIGFTGRVRTDKTKCSNCGRCIDSCMVWALRFDGNQKIIRDDLSCISCRECEKTCPEEAVSYGKN